MKKPGWSTRSVHPYYRFILKTDDLTLKFKYQNCNTYLYYQYWNFCWVIKQYINFFDSLDVEITWPGSGAMSTFLPERYYYFFVSLKFNLYITSDIFQTRNPDQKPLNLQTIACIERFYYFGSYIYESDMFREKKIIC